MPTLTLRERRLAADAWHSIKPGRRYHNNGACTEGNSIELEYWEEGTGNLHQCKHCIRLNLKDAAERGV